MRTGSYQFYDDKIIIRIRNTICDTPEELLSNEVFVKVLKNYVHMLASKQSRLLRIFADEKMVTDGDIRELLETLQYLVKLPADVVARIQPEGTPFLRDLALLNDFVEQLYNYWRSLHRLIVCDSIGDRYDKRPYRTFNDTVETLMDVVRRTYRDIQENITGNHPRIYRQVSAGAEVAAIARPMNIDYPGAVYKRLNSISVTSQVLIYPPMIFNTPVNKRSGMFERVDHNPLESLDLVPQDWLCYPARVGELLIMIYFHMRFFELGFALCNLFELADAEDLKRKPDAVFLYGVPTDQPHEKGACETIFYDDVDNDLLVATIPGRDEYGYFGYLKKMTLTLHNIKMLKRGRLPFHGAMFHLVLRNAGAATFLVMGDTGAGKSETLEALRGIIKDDVEELVVVADDMGSLALNERNEVIGYGTEMGAFVRLDDLASGYAFGQIDRTILMNADQVNARVVIPISKYADVVRGYPVDFVLYANNYDVVDAEHPVIHLFDDANTALEVFRSGAVMSKGTTTSTGLVHSFYANIFGPPQYPDDQDRLARQYFEKFFEAGILVGELRTQLGVPGMEHTGPEIAANELLKVIMGNARKPSDDGAQAAGQKA